jgi:NADPH:quinone reductase-like Zn-dependent oxidoreductase
VRAAAVNPSDIKNAAGLMHQTTLPRIPGRDFAGVVVAGPDAWLGREVWGSGAQFGYTVDGSHAQYLRVPLTALALKPARLDFAEAASVGVPFCTAWLGLIDYADAQPGEYVLVIGAGGSVGQAVAQLARWRGCRVIAASRTPLPPQQAAMFDAQLSIDEQLPERVRAITNGGGAQVVYDTVGGLLFEPALRCLAHRGRLVEISATGHSQVSFDLRDFYRNESQLLGVDSLKLDASAAARLLDRLAPLFESGSLRPPAVDRQVTLDQLIDAYQHVARGEGGRHVLINAATD